MTQKEKTKKMVDTYHTYARTVNCNIKSQKGLSSGIHGRDFEAQVKFYGFGNYRFKTVAAPAFNGRDTIKYGVTVECKTNNGEFCKLDENGDMYRIINTDYICYCWEYDPNYSATEQCYFIKTELFNQFILDNGFIVNNRNTSDPIGIYTKMNLRFDTPFKRTKTGAYPKRVKILLDFLESKGMYYNDFMELVVKPAHERLTFAKQAKNGSVEISTTAL